VKPLRRFFLVSMALVALHAVLLHWMADRNVMSVIFSAGRHVPGHLLALAGLFIFVRLWVVLFLPGLVMYQLVQACPRPHQRMGSSKNEGDRA
jgi:hypothetical protein